MEKKSMYMRSVSIIGIGQTKYGDAGTEPELKDMSLQDMAQWACVQAMEDAGVNPRDIGKLILGQVCSPNYTSNTLAPAMGLGEFLGMKGKPCVYHNEVCGTSPCCFDEAVTAVASGAYDIAMCVDADSVRYMSHPYMPSCYRLPSSEHAKYYHSLGIGSGNDAAYVNWSGAYFAQNDAPARHYLRAHGLTDEDMDDAFIGQAITERHHGNLNPNAFMRTPWEDIAAKRGFDDTRAYLKSKYNPKYSEYMRPSFAGPMGEGATAIIVCATDLAGRYRQKPIEVVGTARVDASDFTPAVECVCCEQAVAQVYERTGYGPEDIEYLQTTDMDLGDALYSAEACGYLPEGHGWEYFRDGKTAFDAEKPMNTDGGHCNMGHAFSATQMATIIEPVRQLRGQAGARQIPSHPKTALVRCQGGYQVTLAAIFRAVDGVNDEVEPFEPKYVRRPYVRMFYDGLDEGKFLGSRCPECGAVEFPLYSVCNTCGHIGNEIIEVSGDATVTELYTLSPTYTPAIMAPYAPIFACEAKLAEGSEFTSLIFGVTPETYPELREQVPFAAKLVAMPDSQGFGYHTFALSINGAVPVPKEGVGMFHDASHIREGSLDQGK